MLSNEGRHPLYTHLKVVGDCGMRWFGAKGRATWARSGGALFSLMPFIFGRLDDQWLKILLKGGISWFAMSLLDLWVHQSMLPLHNSPWIQPTSRQGLVFNMSVFSCMRPKMGSIGLGPWLTDVGHAMRLAFEPNLPKFSLVGSYIDVYSK
jgi:hypothetical protein